MSEYEMMKNMLQRVAPNTVDFTRFIVDEKERTIELCCYDDWYTRTFYFDKKGRLVRLE